MALSTLLGECLWSTVAQHHQDHPLHGVNIWYGQNRGTVSWPFHSTGQGAGTPHSNRAITPTPGYRLQEGCAAERAGRKVTVVSQGMASTLSGYVRTTCTMGENGLKYKPHQAHCGHDAEKTALSRGCAQWGLLKAHLFQRCLWPAYTCTLTLTFCPISTTPKTQI